MPIHVICMYTSLVQLTFEWFEDHGQNIVYALDYTERWYYNYCVSTQPQLIHGSPNNSVD